MPKLKNTLCLSVAIAAPLCASVAVAAVEPQGTTQASQVQVTPTSDQAQTASRPTAKIAKESHGKSKTPTEASRFHYKAQNTNRSPTQTDAFTSKVGGHVTKAPAALPYHDKTPPSRAKGEPFEKLPPPANSQ